MQQVKILINGIDVLIISSLKAPYCIGFLLYYPIQTLNSKKETNSGVEVSLFYFTVLQCIAWLNLFLKFILTSSSEVCACLNVKKGPITCCHLQLLGKASF